ncbi:MAG: hypothetical protein SV760_00370, partial [Halobacteria archaeon]|nr:hypothetical protein [Halobacteria archaeon]
YPVRTDTDEVTVNVYSYTAEMVFENATEYARSLRQRYMFRLADLSEDERSVLREAIDGGYYAENTDDRAFGSLIKKLRRHESITGNDDTSGEWLVRYGGDTYWVEASYGRFTR